MEASKKGKIRQPWIDYVRFLSIFLVIMFHTPPQLPLLDNAVILNLRMPIFFCISGYLYSIAKYKNFLRYFLHRGKQILVPYTTFFVFFYALWLAVGRDMVGASEQTISKWLPLVEFVKGNPTVVVAPFWYIACLFTMQMLYYWVERLVPRRMVFLACVGLSIASNFAPYVEWWNFTHALQFLPFYAFGNSFKGYIGGIAYDNNKKVWLMLAMAAASMCVMAAVLPLKGEMRWCYNMVQVAAGIMVIPAYLCLGKWVAAGLGRRHVVEFVVVSGTVYLGMQNYFIGFIKICLNRVFYDGVIDDNAWLKVVIALVVMAAIYPFAVIIDRYAPWILGKGKYFDKI